MGQLFGTDGIRGLANTYPITPEIALKVGRAIGQHFRREERSSIVIGRDTRISGTMLESAIVSGCCSVGCDAIVCKILPTPAIAYLTKNYGAAAGVVISASHNPYYDNGIKIFDQNGYKLSENTELLLEELILNDKPLKYASESIRNTGIRIDNVDGEKQYSKFLIESTSNEYKFNELNIVLDCANGATHKIAPKLFAGLGASVEALHSQPDGKNINLNCGSQHPETLSKRVKAINAQIGLAFDGDGDRLVAVDEMGEVLTGDQILAICAKHYKDNGKLNNNTVVSTVMSNMGLGNALENLGIHHEVTSVGDRYVMEKMLDFGAVLGGEDSGHTVFLNHHTTGDGMLSALNLLGIMVTENKPLSELKTVMTMFPQVLINVNVKRKPPLETIPEIKKTIHEAENKLAGKGRVLVRYSGTQPQCRVMVEGSEVESINILGKKIAQAIKDIIGS